MRSLCRPWHGHCTFFLRRYKELSTVIEISFFSPSYYHDGGISSNPTLQRCLSSFETKAFRIEDDHVTQFAAMIDDIRDTWEVRPDGKKDGLVLFSGDLFSPSVESSVTRGSHMVSGNTGMVIGWLPKRIHHGIGTSHERNLSRCLSNWQSWLRLWFVDSRWLTSIYNTNTDCIHRSPSFDKASQRLQIRECSCSILSYLTQGICTIALAPKQCHWYRD